MINWLYKISNSISKRGSNGNGHCQTDKLLDILFSVQNRIPAFLYVQIANSPVILQKLKSKGLVILDVTTCRTSTRKRNNPNFVSDLKNIHPNIETGRNLLHTTLKNRNNLRNLDRGNRSFWKNRLR